jgi:hypothetical protein
MLERRLSPRIPFFETVPLQKLDKEAVIHGHSIEISTLGIGLRSDVPLQPKQRCRIAFNLSVKKEAHKVVLDCEATSCGYTEDYRGYRIGFQFVDVPANDANLLDGYIQAELSNA